MNTLKELRDDKSWSQEELARRANISTSTVHCQEHGKRTATAATVLALARALEVEPRVLRYLRGEPTE